MAVIQRAIDARRRALAIEVRVGDNTASEHDLSSTGEFPCFSIRIAPYQQYPFRFLAGRANRPFHAGILSSEFDGVKSLRAFRIGAATMGSMRTRRGLLGTAEV